MLETTVGGRWSRSREESTDTTAHWRNRTTTDAAPCRLPEVHADKKNYLRNIYYPNRIRTIHPRRDFSSTPPRYHVYASA